MPFTYIGKSEEQVPDQIEQGKPSGFTYVGSEPEESGVKSAIRYGAQVPLGMAKKATWPADMLKAMTAAYGLEEMRELKNEDPEFNEEAYRNALSNAIGFIPTQDSLEEFVEKHTGIPLVAKTKGQKLLRSGVETATITPGKFSTKAVAGISQPAGQLGLEEAGVPEEIASPISQIASGGTAALSEKMAKPTLKSIAKKTEKIPINPPGISKTLEGKKISSKPAGLQIQPAKLDAPRSIKEEIGMKISSMKFSNSTVGGKSIQSEVMDLDKKVYKNVNNLYEKSRELNKGISDVHPELVKNIENRLAELNEIPSPSGPEKDLIKTLEEMRDSLYVKNPDGSFSYKPIKNSVLIKQKQSLQNKVDFDFQHGSPKNIFKPTIEDISTALERTGAKNPEAYQALKDADKAYGEWANTFNNDYIKPIRDKTNKSYSKLFKDVENIDNFNQLDEVLKLSNKGKQISSALKRDVVNRKLGKYLGTGKTHLTLGEDFANELDELSAILSPEELGFIKNKMRVARRTEMNDLAKNLKEKGLIKKGMEWVLDPTNAPKILKSLGYGTGVYEIGKHAIEGTKD